MPLFMLKHSPKAVPTLPYKTIFATLNDILVKTIDNGKVSACKSWTEQIDDVHMGDGSHPDAALVVLVIAFYRGRPIEQQNSLADQALRYLQEVYADAEIRIVVEVRELNPETCAIA